MCPTFDSNLAARNRNLIIFLVPGFLMDEQATSFLSWLLNLFLFFLRRCIKNCMEASFCFFNLISHVSSRVLQPQTPTSSVEFFSTVKYHLLHGSFTLLPYEKYSQLFRFICLIPWNDYWVDWTFRWLVFCLKSPKSRKTASWEKKTTKNWGTILLSNCINA